MENHLLGSLYTTETFLTVLEAEKSKIKMLEDSVSGESLLLAHRWLAIFSLCPHMAAGVKKLFGASFLFVCLFN